MLALEAVAGAAMFSPRPGRGSSGSGASLSASSASSSSSVSFASSVSSSSSSSGGVSPDPSSSGISRAITLINEGVRVGGNEIGRLVSSAGGTLGVSLSQAAEQGKILINQSGCGGRHGDDGNSFIVASHYGDGPSAPQRAEFDTAARLAHSSARGPSSLPGSIAREAESRISGNCNFGLALQMQTDAAGCQTGRILAVTSPGRAHRPHGAAAASPAQLATRDSQTVACTYRWRRKTPHTNDARDVDGVHGNVYQLSADDIGSLVVVEATPVSSSSPEYWGTAVGELGPFQVDGRCRQLVDEALASGSARFPCRIISSTGSATGGHSSDAILHLLTDEVQLTEPASGGMGSLRKWSAAYAGGFPKVRLHPTDNKKLTIILSSSADDHVECEALARHQRDAIALAVRCFQARNLITTSAIMNHLMTLPDCGADGVSEEGEVDAKVDLVALVSSLSEDLSACLSVSDRCRRDRDRLQHEKKALENEMVETIGAFQEQLCHLQPDGNPLYSTYRAAAEEQAQKLKELKLQLDQSERLQSVYQRELLSLRSNLNQATGDNDTSGNHNLNQQQTLNELKQLQKLLKQYKTQNEILVAEKNKLEKDKNSNQFQGWTGLGGGSGRQATARSFAVDPLERTAREAREEATRMTAELEEKHLEKERLSRELSEASRSHQHAMACLSKELKEVQDAFLHTKARHDKQLVEIKELSSRCNHLQRELESQAASSNAAIENSNYRAKEYERELERVNRAMQETMAERNRLLKRVESLSKDLEKSRTSSASQLTRLVDGSQALQMEKTKVDEELASAQKESAELKKNVHELEAQLLRAKRGVSSRSVTVETEASEIGGGGRPCAASVASELQEANKKLEEGKLVVEKLQGENKTLKSRIRKLAKA
eukprot:GHVT01101076.1.p1 GENE.GHVT01101076.1~~GHVT01101076.1.p1  ORF type:complete len:891 (+),score=253.30 GHVT01101076.1:113-2785(+)